MSGRLVFQVLGGLRAQRDGVELDLGGARQRRVLAVLLLASGQPIPAERLMELVWGDEPPTSARVSLQSYISKLRTVLEPGRRSGSGLSQLIVNRPGGYALEVDPRQVDLPTSERHVATAIAAHAAGRFDDAIAAIEPVLDRWGPVLPELAHEPFVVSVARRSEALRATATEVLARARLAVGDHLAAVADLRTAVADDPRAEAPWALLALALYRSGRQAEALDAIASARRVLRDECGLEVGEELRNLEADLLAQSPALAATAVATPPARRASPVVRRPGCGAGRRDHGRRGRCPSAARPG